MREDPREVTLKRLTANAGSRRRFLKLSGSALVAPVLLPRRTTEAAAQFSLEETTISAVQDAMKSGQLSSKQITNMYLTRIGEVDQSGPALKSVIEVNPEAEAIADALDQERRSRGPRGPLHGIPVLIKANIDTGDRMETTAGSLALAGHPAQKDAFVVEKLRQAGAVIIGKTNLSEWANFRSSHSTSGWSGVGGQTRNPYVLDRNPCGSSSGSGAATAASLCVVAVGTETDGSIVCPSSANGLAGIKPTLGIVSRSGIIPIAHSQDTAGPMARTLADAAILLTVIAGIDPRDKATLASRGKAFGGYSRDPAALRGARLGVMRKSFGFNDAVDKLIGEAIDTLKRLGAVIIDPGDIPTHGKFEDSENEVLLYEFKADLNSYLKARGSSVAVHSLKEIIEFNQKNAGRELIHFGQDLMIKAEAKGPLTSPGYLRALTKNHRLSRAEGIDAVMDAHRLDALIAPTGGPAWPTDHLNGDHFTGGFSTEAAVAGYPHVTVPAGFISELPVGLSFSGRAYSDAKLIGYAYAFEQATKVRRAPKFLPGV